MIFIIGVLRFYFRDLFGGGGAANPAPKSIEITRQAIEQEAADLNFALLKEEVPEDTINGNAITRSSRLRKNASFIPQEAVKNRKSFFTREASGFFTKEMAAHNPMQAMMNPDMMGSMLKNNMFMMVYNIILFQVTGFFFSGFINAKMPFPLAQSFRSMLQQGLTLSSLDVRYVSSLSWCFLCLYGLQGVQSLLIGDSNLMEDMKMGMGMGMGGGDQQGAAGMPGQPKDWKALFKSEGQNYEIMTHEFALAHAEDEVLRQHKENK